MPFPPLYFALVAPISQTYPNFSCLQVFAVVLLPLGMLFPLVPSCLFIAWLIPPHSLSLSVDTLSLGGLPDSSQWGYLPDTPLGFEPLLVRYFWHIIIVVLNHYFYPQVDIWQCPRDIYGWRNWERGCLLLALSGESQGDCLLLQCTEHCSTAQNSPVQNARGAEVEKPFFIVMVYLLYYHFLH